MVCRGDEDEADEAGKLKSWPVERKAAMPEKELEQEEKKFGTSQR